MPGSKLGPYSVNTIIAADAMEVLPKLPDECVDLIVTDPPYGISYLSGYRTQLHPSNVPIVGDSDEVWDILPDVACELWRVAVPDSACFVFTRWDCWDKLKAAMSPWECKNMIVWDKLNHTAGDLKGNFGFAHELIYFGVKGRPLIRGRRVWNIWQYPRVPADKLLHPSEKPVLLAEIAIRAMSDEGGLVFDPFCGSGAILVAAKRLGRKWLGVDILEEYAELSRTRIANTQPPLFVI